MTEEQPAKINVPKNRRAQIFFGLFKPSLLNFMQQNRGIAKEREVAQRPPSILIMSVTEGKKKAISKVTHVKTKVSTKFQVYEKSSFPKIVKKNCCLKGLKAHGKATVMHPMIAITATKIGQFLPSYPGISFLNRTIPAVAPKEEKYPVIAINAQKKKSTAMALSITLVILLNSGLTSSE